MDFLARLRFKRAESAPCVLHIGENQMSAYEMQNLETERRCDQMMRDIEASGCEVLNSVVPGSRLHEIIHNPVTEGIDEG